MTAAFVMFGTATAALAQPNYEPRSVSALIDRVHDDLGRAYQVWNFSSGDRKRLDHAEHDLRDFANKWARGRFDKGELDEAISGVHHVVDHNQMPPREREVLYRDLEQLRGMREAYDRHELGGDYR
jgi:hypothetical protein